MERLNYIAPLNSLGYGQVGYHLLIELSKLYDVACWPVRDTINYPVPDHEKAIVQKALDNQATFDKNAPCLRVWHQFDMGPMIGKGPHIGFPIFELNRFTDREKHHLKSLDEIFVCSSWAQDVVKQEIGRESHIIPLGVDLSDFPFTEVKKDGPTVFLNVGKWEIRKGHDVIIEAFMRAFNDCDNVELWMMNGNPFLNEKQTKEWENLYTNHHLGHKVKLLPRVETQRELAQIMAKADCGVFPARAEGWNLEVLEMMACGRHVITTNYSAHKDFCNPLNSILIDINELEPAWDGIWFHGQGEWAKIGNFQIDEIALAMQGMHKAKIKGELNSNKTGRGTASYLTWANSAERIKETIRLFTSLKGV